MGNDVTKCLEKVLNIIRFSSAILKQKKPFSISWISRENNKFFSCLCIHLTGKHRTLCNLKITKFPITRFNLLGLAETFWTNESSKSLSLPLFISFFPDQRPKNSWRFSHLYLAKKHSPIEYALCFRVFDLNSFYDKLCVPVNCNVLFITLK